MPTRSTPAALPNIVFVETKFTDVRSRQRVGQIPLAASSSNRPDDGCATERKGSQQFTDASPYTAMVNRDYRLEFCPAAALKPLSADIAALKKTVDETSRRMARPPAISASNGAGTCCRRDGRTFCQAASKPAAYNPKKVAKYAILMTDGEFNTAFAGVPKKGETTGAQASRSRNYAEKLCDAMKKDGIEIFTIGFMLKEAGAKAVLGDCASPDDGSVKHYFETSSGDRAQRGFPRDRHATSRA